MKHVMQQHLTQNKVLYVLNLLYIAICTFLWQQFLDAKMFSITIFIHEQSKFYKVSIT